MWKLYPSIDTVDKEENKLVPFTK